MEIKHAHLLLVSRCYIQHMFSYIVGINNHQNFQIPTFVWSLSHKQYNPFIYRYIGSADATCSHYQVDGYYVSDCTLFVIVRAFIRL